MDFPEDWSEKNELLPVEGLETAGESALRNSVYAVGGVMGVLMSSSCLIMSRKPGAGLLGNSEGRAADRGGLMDERPEVLIVGVLRLGV